MHGKYFIKTNVSREKQIRRKMDKNPSFEHNCIFSYKYLNLSMKENHHWILAYLKKTMSLGKRRLDYFSRARTQDAQLLGELTLSLIRENNKRFNIKYNIYIYIHFLEIKME